jgi:exosortase/archaeosortase family protein
MQGNVLIPQKPGSNYTPILLFVIKVLGLFAILFFLKFVHRSVIAPDSGFIYASAIRDINIYSVCADFLIYPSQLIINFLGFKTIISERVISIVGARGIIIHGPCLGFNIFGAFIILILAYPSVRSWKVKGLFIMIGLLVIQFLNILRVTALLIKNRYEYELPVNHHDLFNIIIYSFVFFAFYMWIKFYSNRSLNVSSK